VKLTITEITCHRCGLPAKLTKIPPTGRILGCELCGEFGIRTVDGHDVYTEFKLPYGSPFYEALGRFVVAFAMAESGFDFLNYSIFHHAGGKNIVKRLPRTFETKVDYLTKAVEQLDVLQFRATELRETLAIFEGIVKRRHYYIHGIYGTHFVAPLSFEKPNIVGETFSLDLLEADVPSILEDQTSAMAVAGFFMIVSYQLAQSISTHQSASC
jgi:hypothetical protein